jgi:hypothetical protein
MTLDEILRDIHALEEDLGAYERKFGVLSETFYESYTSGEEPADDAWVLDWSDWAGAYELWLRRKQQYRDAIRRIQQDTTLAKVIQRAARREPLPVPA